VWRLIGSQPKQERNFVPAYLEFTIVAGLYLFVSSKRRRAKNDKARLFSFVVVGFGRFRAIFLMLIQQLLVSSHHQTSSTNHCYHHRAARQNSRLYVLGQ